jgi:putative hydrolase of the HAD superfamily
MIKAMLFDVDGVLAVGESFSKILAREQGITRETAAPFYTGPFVQCLIGKADLKQELAAYLPQWQWRGSIDEFVRYWLIREHVLNEPLIDAIQKLRRQGTRCYVATNQEQYRTRYILEGMGFAETFDGMFSSCAIGYTKDDIAFFEHVLHILNDVQPREILFWDDSPGNVAVAREAGLHAEVYCDFADFMQKVRAYFPE